MRKQLQLSKPCFSGLFILCIALSPYCQAQKYDNVMILGYHYYMGGPIPILDFTYGSPDTAAIYSPLDMMGTNASICDSSGLLQFYTNGVIVANKYGQVLDNSLDFNYDLIMPNLGVT